ncbi:efflux RND transporter periplasmic adaptor subunit [Rheinheimera sp.]|uniref:efflux RND transporter periplasmic adaptor subunit n=1 Tax=Rheinheimera sp. TaxID=1869214 RepID=UPI00307D2FB0
MKKLTLSALTLALTCTLAACSKPTASPVATEAELPLQLVSQDLLQLTQAQLALGPVISGSLQPVTKAALNAEVSGIVMQVLKDNGDAVQAGDVLVKLDPTIYRDKLLSAQEAVRSAEVSLAQANRQLKRMQSLSKQNLVTQEGLESAENKANQSQSDLASAKARLVEARQQLEKTEVRAPFSGVVAQRYASAGDTAQVGKSLMLLIDPASIRFEGFIAADRVGQVKMGQQVRFKVNGYQGKFFSGTVERINPLANENTRQVQILVQMEKTAEPLVAGLYAEGHIESDNRQALMVPQSALVKEGDHAYLWQLKDNLLNKVPVELGEQDMRLGTQQILSGISAGATVLRHPQGALKEGAKAELVPASGAASQTAAQSGSGV